MTFAPFFRNMRRGMVVVAMSGVLVGCAYGGQAEPVSDGQKSSVSGAVVEMPSSPPSPPSKPAPPSVVLPPLPVVSDAQARQEAHGLQKEMRQKIARFTPYTPARRAIFVQMAQNAIEQSGTKIDRPQVIMVVDRAESVQRADFILALPDAPWESIGGAPVSTGTTARKYYYITPTGVYQNTADRLGYRAEGTKNKFGIRGIGAKGSRVWDLGWHTAMKGWLPRHETGQIRLEIHATDPQFLEWRLGHSASEGCIRIPAALNQIMDHDGLIDALYEQAASSDKRFAALLLKDRAPLSIAGDVIVVIDSGPGTEPKIDPLADKRELP
ncbi:L,D-transpeptidase [Neokomagataea thailandica]|uniref:L,D-transpeptidase n=1 Tax=Neokomagataea TaxID=1223423 RepID=UPI000835A8DE|nr:MULTISPECIES: L,D-transpeptidase [Neokomagataea]